MLKDTEQRLKAYFNRREKYGKGESWNTRDVALIKKSLREEYFPRPKKEEIVDPEKLEDTKVAEKFEPFFEGEETRGTETHQEPEH